MATVETLQQRVAELEERLRTESQLREGQLLEYETSAQAMEKRFQAVSDELQARINERDGLVKERSELTEQVNKLTGEVTAMRSDKIELERSLDSVRKERDEHAGLNRQYETLLQQRRLELDQKDKALEQHLQVSIDIAS